jgi:hypothetical protein
MGTPLPVSALAKHRSEICDALDARWRSTRFRPARCARLGSAGDTCVGCALLRPASKSARSRAGHRSHCSDGGDDEPSDHETSFSGFLAAATDSSSKFESSSTRTAPRRLEDLFAPHHAHETARLIAEAEADPGRVARIHAARERVHRARARLAQYKRALDEGRRQNVQPLDLLCGR